MKYVATFTITVVTFFVLSGNALAGGDAKAGKATYDSKCKMCHGADGKGNASLAKAMPTLPDLTTEKTQSKKDAELKKQIEEGGGKMKPVKGLSEQHLTDVIAFIRSLAKA